MQPMIYEIIPKVRVGPISFDMTIEDVYLVLQTRENVERDNYFIIGKSYYFLEGNLLSIEFLHTSPTVHSVTIANRSPLYREDSIANAGNQMVILPVLNGQSLFETEVDTVINHLMEQGFQYTTREPGYTYIFPELGMALGRANRPEDFQDFLDHEDDEELESWFIEDERRRMLYFEHVTIGSDSYGDNVQALLNAGKG